VKGTTITKLLDLETSEPEQLWGPAICTHNLVMVFGGTGVGKSYFAWKLLYTLASTGRFLNHDVRRPSKVLLIEGELGLSTTKRRLQRIQAEAPFSPRGDYFRVLSKDHTGGRLWNISDPSDQRKFNSVIADADVILIDNLLSSVFPLNRYDDDVKQWDRIIPWLFSIRDSGRTVIMVHHTGKSGLQLGTSIKENWLDTNIELRRPEADRAVRGTEFELIYRKTRDVKRCDALPLHVEFIEGEDGVSRWSWRALEDSKRELIRSMKSEGLSKREVAKQLGLSYREVNSAWEDMEINL
jgi:predicted ATP-dependent serine protease